MSKKKITLSLTEKEASHLIGILAHLIDHDTDPTVVSIFDSLNEQDVGDDEATFVYNDDTGMFEMIDAIVE